MIPDSLGATFARIKEIQGLLDHLNPEAATPTPTPTSPGTFQEALAAQLRPADAAELAPQMPAAATRGFALPAGAALDHYGASPLAATDSRGWETDLPSAKLAEQVLTGQGAPESRGSDKVPAAYRQLVRDASRKYGVDEALILAVMQTESDFNPRVVSSAGAMGLMQLMPANVREYGIADAFDPAQNIDAGVRHLRDMLQRYDGDVKLALAGYNAGPGNVAKYGGVPPFAETRNYIPKVLARAETFRQQPAAATPAPPASVGLPATPDLAPVSPMPVQGLAKTPATLPLSTPAPGTAQGNTAVGEAAAAAPVVSADHAVAANPAATTDSGITTGPAVQANAAVSPPAVPAVTAPAAAQSDRGVADPASPTEAAPEPPVASQPAADTRPAAAPPAARQTPPVADAPRPQPATRADQRQAPLLQDPVPAAPPTPQAPPVLADSAHVPDRPEAPSTVPIAGPEPAEDGAAHPRAAEPVPMATQATFVRPTPPSSYAARPASAPTVATPYVAAPVEPPSADSPAGEPPAAAMATGPASDASPAPEARPVISQPVDRQAREQALQAAAQSPPSRTAPGVAVTGDGEPVVVKAAPAEQPEPAHRVRLSASNEAAEPLLRKVVGELPGVAAAHRMVTRVVQEVVAPVQHLVDQLGEALSDGPVGEPPLTTPPAADPAAARTAPELPDRPAPQRGGERGETLLAQASATPPVAAATQADLSDGGGERPSRFETQPVHGPQRADAQPAAFSLEQASRPQAPATDGVGRAAMTLDQPRDLTTELVHRARLLRSPGRDEFNVELRHPEAGAVSVRVVRQAEAVHVTLTCAHSGLRRELQAQMPELQAALRQQGLELGSFDTATPQQQQQPGPGSFGQPQHQAALPRQREATVLPTYTPPEGGDDDTRPSNGGGLAVWA